MDIRLRGGPPVHALFCHINMYTIRSVLALIAGEDTIRSGRMRGCLLNGQASTVSGTDVGQALTKGHTTLPCQYRTMRQVPEYEVYHRSRGRDDKLSRLKRNELTLTFTPHERGNKACGKAPSKPHWPSLELQPRASAPTTGEPLSPSGERTMSKSNNQSSNAQSRGAGRKRHWKANATDYMHTGTYTQVRHACTKAGALTSNPPLAPPPPHSLSCSPLALSLQLRWAA